MCPYRMRQSGRAMADYGSYHCVRPEWRWLTVFPRSILFWSVLEFPVCLNKTKRALVKGEFGFKVIPCDLLVIGQFSELNCVKIGWFVGSNILCRKNFCPLLCQCSFSILRQTFTGKKHGSFAREHPNRVISSYLGFSRSGYWNQNYPTCIRNLIPVYFCEGWKGCFGMVKPASNSSMSSWVGRHP